MCLLLALGSPAVAGEPLRMGEITVEASPIDPYLPARTEVDRSEIIDAHKSELSDVLELTPGINVRQGGKGEVRVDMRGFDQRATLYILDGVPVYEPYNGIINADLFPLEMLSGMEITRGASSSLYGPNGMGGQIKLDTFAPRPPLGATVSTMWRDADLWDVRASGSAAHEGWSGFAAGRYLTTSGFWLADDFKDRPDSQRRFQNGSKRVNSDRDQLSGFASLGYQYGNEGRAHVAVLASDATFGIPPSTTQFGQLVDPGQYAPIIERVDPERLLHVQAGFEQRLLPAVGVAGGLFYTSYDYHDTQYFPDANHTHYDPLDYSSAVTTVTDSHELGGIGRVTLDIGDGDTLAVGGQVRGDGVDLSSTTHGALGHPGVTVASVGVENVYAATNRISLVLGASEEVQTGARIGTRSEFDPQGIVSLDLDQWGAARIAVARKIRLPTLRELFDKDQGNPHLAPENTLTYEIGHRVSRAWGYAGLNLFRSDVDNLIAGGGDNHFMNVQEVTLQGVEVAGGVMPVERVRLDVTYTFLDTTAHDKVPLSPVSSSAVQHKPAHRFNGVLQLSLPWKLLLRMEGLYTSKQLDRLNSDVIVGGFALWNVQITRPVGKWVSIFAGTDDLLDIDYEQKQGTPEPGRRAFAGFRATY